MNQEALTFQAYQERALSTAVYPRQYVLTGGQTLDATSPSCVYPVFGLCGEIGEVAQVFANKLSQTCDLCSECGDVLWYIAAICSDLHINMHDVAGVNTFQAFDGYEFTASASIEELLIELFVAAGIVAEATKKTIRDSAGVVTDVRLAIIKKALERVLLALSAICQKKDLNLAVVAQANLDKLAARAAKGTIQGSGDNR